MLSADLDAQWKARLAGRKLYTNELFLTLIRRPPQGRVGWVQSLIGGLGAAVDSAEADAGLARELGALDAARDALLAFVLTVSMLSLAGIPLTAGFWGKFFVFGSAAEAGTGEKSPAPPLWTWMVAMSLQRQLQLQQLLKQTLYLQGHLSWLLRIQAQHFLYSISILPTLSPHHND